MTRPTPRPIVKPPHKKANSCSMGRGLFSMSTARPSRIGSKITASAITSTVIHMYGNRTAVTAAPRRNVSQHGIQS